MVIHNNLGYDAVIGAYLNITAASVVTVSVGVGSTSPPTTYPVVSAYTSATPTLLPVTAYVPNGYYFIVDVSDDSVTESITAQWFPT